MRLHILAILATFGLITSSLEATPGQVILLRHGEKPEQGNYLTKTGFIRAAALVPFFTLPPANSGFKTPNVIFAQSPDKSDKSVRPVQTVAPLAAALGVELIAEYHKHDYAKLVKEINSNSAYDGLTVLICWAHEKIPHIASAFGVQNPPKFPDVFDRVWVIDFDGDQVLSFQDFPQQLLYGDSES